MPTISGKWRFNETLASIDYTEQRPNQYVNFICDGKEYVKIIANISNGIKYDNGLSDGNSLTPYSSNYWKNDNYRNIDFGTTPQEVSEDFYNWFTANATKLSEEEEPEAPIGKTITFDLSTLNLNAGTYQIQTRAKAKNYEPSPLSNSLTYTYYPSNQTLTLTSQLTNKSISFTMPLNYTFDDFIGSEYDTSGGLFTIEQGTNRYCYNGFYIMFSNGGYVGGGSAMARGNFILTHPNAVAGSYFCNSGYVALDPWMFRIPFESNGSVFQGIVADADGYIGLSSQEGWWYITNYEGLNGAMANAPYNGIQVYITNEEKWINDSYRTINILGEIVLSSSDFSSFNAYFSKIS